MSLRRIFRSRGEKKRLHLDAGVLEAIGSFILLPLAALDILYLQLRQFGALSPSHQLSIGIAGLGVLFFGVRAIGHFNKIKDVMGSDLKTPAPSDADTDA